MECWGGREDTWEEERAACIHRRFKERVLDGPVLRQRESVGLDMCSPEPSSSLEAPACLQNRVLVGGSLAALSVLCPKKKKDRSESRKHSPHIFISHIRGAQSLLNLCHEYL